MNSKASTIPRLDESPIRANREWHLAETVERRASRGHQIEVGKLPVVQKAKGSRPQGGGHTDSKRRCGHTCYGTLAEAVRRPVS